MATRVFRSRLIEYSVFNNQQIRHGHRMRGVPPNEGRNLKQRLQEMNAQDPELAFKVNIGFKHLKYNRKEIMKTWTAEFNANRNDPNLERKSRYKELNIDLKKVKEDWQQTIGHQHIKRIAEHYGIFQDLYGDAYFLPILPLDIEYDLLQNELIPKVYTGNILKPSETEKPPNIKYDADPNSLWTLLMTTPDGNLSDPNNEYCHWFIGNIPGNDVTKGEQFIDYLRPIPPRGLGYCRYIFVLYKQAKVIDYSGYKKPQPCLSLIDRNWNTLDFYRKYQDLLTPAGLAFFQADWDQSLTNFYRNSLQMKEPVFEYDFPAKYIRKQVWFPIKEPFNLYLDRYRDPKQINKEYLLKKLKKVHPFKGPERPLMFPNAIPNKRGTPTWLTLEHKKERLGWGRINEIK